MTRDYDCFATFNLIEQLGKVAFGIGGLNFACHRILPIGLYGRRPKSIRSRRCPVATGLRRGYGDPRWLTYKQAAENGCQVRKGEKGTQIEYWEFPSRKTSTDKDPQQPGDTAREKTAAIASVIRITQKRSCGRN